MWKILLEKQFGLNSTSFHDGDNRFCVRFSSKITSVFKDPFNFIPNWLYTEVIERQYSLDQRRKACWLVASRLSSLAAT